MFIQISRAHHNLPVRGSPQRNQIRIKYLGVILNMVERCSCLFLHEPHAFSTHILLITAYRTIQYT